MLHLRPKFQINCHDRPRPARCVPARGYRNLGEDPVPGCALPRGREKLDELPAEVTGLVSTRPVWDSQPLRFVGYGRLINFLLRPLEPARLLAQTK